MDFGLQNSLVSTRFLGIRCLLLIFATLIELESLTPEIYATETNLIYCLMSHKDFFYINTVDRVDRLSIEVNH